MSRRLKPKTIVDYGLLQGSEFTTMMPLIGSTFPLTGGPDFGHIPKMSTTGSKPSIGPKVKAGREVQLDEYIAYFED